MAKEFKGEVALTYDGKSYKMTLDFNAFCDFEGETGKNALVALEGMEHGDVSATEMRALMWAGLRQHHEDMTLSLAGKILSTNMDAVARASAVAMPEGGDAGNGQRPKRQGTKRGRATGTRP